MRRSRSALAPEGCVHPADITLLTNTATRPVTAAIVSVASIQSKPVVQTFLKQDFINCLRAPPIMLLACALQSFIFCRCELSCASTGAISATKIAAATIYPFISRSLPRAGLAKAS